MIFFLQNKKIHLLKTLLILKDVSRDTGGYLAYNLLEGRGISRPTFHNHIKELHRLGIAEKPYGSKWKIKSWDKIFQAIPEMRGGVRWTIHNDWLSNSNEDFRTLCQHIVLSSYIQIGDFLDIYKRTVDSRKDGTTRSQCAKMATVEQISRKVVYGNSAIILMKELFQYKGNSSVCNFKKRVVALGLGEFQERWIDTGVRHSLGAKSESSRLINGETFYATRKGLLANKEFRIYFSKKFKGKGVRRLDSMMTKILFTGGYKLVYDYKNKNYRILERVSDVYVTDNQRIVASARSSNGTNTYLLKNCKLNMCI